MPESNRFTCVLKEILNMPYYKTYAASSGFVHNISNHESAISDILLKNKFKKVTEKIKCKTIYDWINNPDSSNMEYNTFIEQPCGKNSSPDFIICTIVNNHKQIIPLEAKSAESYCPLYNSGGIKDKYIYVFSSKKFNKTTFYFGEDIITEKQQEIINQLKLDQKKLELEANNKLKEFDNNNRGISYYTRPMIGQSGKSDKTNYFTHINRKICEDKVLQKFQEV